MDWNNVNVIWGPVEWNNVDVIWGGISTKEQAAVYLLSLEPVYLFAGMMQTDGFRVDGDTTYLAQLSDLSGNENHFTQTTAARQAVFDGAKGVFAGVEYYKGPVIETDGPTTICVGYTKNDTSVGYLIDIAAGRLAYASSASGSGFIDDGYMGDPLVEDGTFDTRIDSSTKGIGGTISVGSLNTYTFGYLKGSISTICLFDKYLSASEEATVTECLNILGGQ